MGLQRGDEHATSSDLRIYYIWKNIKMLQKNEFKMSGPTWDEQLELLTMSNLQEAWNIYW